MFVLKRACTYVQRSDIVQNNYFSNISTLGESSSDTYVKNEIITKVKVKNVSWLNKNCKQVKL